MNRPSSSERLRPTLLLWLIWLSITAVLLAIHREDFVGNDNSRDAEFNARQGTISRINRVARFSVAPFHALCIVGLGTAIWFRIKNRPGFPALPGHWLLVCTGTFSFNQELCRLVWHWLIEPQWDGSDESYERLMLWFHALDAVPFFATMIPTGLACIVQQMPLRWRLVFVLDALTVVTFLAVIVLHAGGYQFFPASEWTEFAANALLQISAFTVAVNAVIDLVARRNQDLFHWLGIVSALAFVAHADALHLSIWYAFLE